jgi:hypothetical protein
MILLYIIFIDHFKWYNSTKLAQWRHGGSMVACQTVVLQSRVRIQRLPSPQLTADLLGWHLAAG